VGECGTGRAILCAVVTTSLKTLVSAPMRPGKQYFATVLSVLPMQAWLVPLLSRPSSSFSFLAAD